MLGSERLASGDGMVLGAGGVAVCSLYVCLLPEGAWNRNGSSANGGYLRLYAISGKV